ncbi:hypothetical protein AK812_SmicGene33445 [Symbiodinium microadriaticum]|uniref:Uncharacterized protein n=1 Tax=Symbiodinium microadriaticum TaxID=2951 RepID=A0A1Q9CRN1_SYMMI|nr:hypothetical protein AK812_SmicGene33445 [Symbiodinium microadriaticum]
MLFMVLGLVPSGSHRIRWESAQDLHPRTSRFSRVPSPHHGISSEPSAFLCSLCLLGPPKKALLFGTATKAGQQEGWSEDLGHLQMSYATGKRPEKNPQVFKFRGVSREEYTNGFRRAEENQEADAP